MSVCRWLRGLIQGTWAIWPPPTNILKSNRKEVGVVEPIYVDGWRFDEGRYSRGSFIVERVGNGLRAMMKQGTDYVQIGTTSISVPGDTTRFLGKVVQFQKLKERVYA